MVWLWQGDSPWHFVSVDKETTAKIDFYFSHAKRGWGSLPVYVKVGETRWKTSIFPDRKTGTYLLPIKAGARKAEGIKAGDLVKLGLEINDSG